MPRTVHVPELELTGRTRPRAFVHAFVDTTDLGTVLADDAGLYELSLPLPELGSHLVRIEVRYGSPENPVAEAMIRSVTRTTDPSLPRGSSPSSA